MKKTLAILAVGLFLANCSKEEKPQFIDPSNAEALSNEITFTSSTTTVNGTPPSATTSATAPQITGSTSASVVASGTVYLPVTYTANTAPSAMLVQVVGATSFYFNIPLPGAGIAGTVTIPMTISARVLTGSFSLYACIVSGGEVSNPVSIFTQVTEPLGCGDGFVSGSEGVTNTRHQLNGVSGNVVITYDTYSVPDRIDVFLDGTLWKGGTGSTISPPPPTSLCSSPLAGFVGASGTITVAVTSANKYIDVYVSGCLGSGTAWDYTLTCP